MKPQILTLFLLLPVVCFSQEAEAQKIFVNGKELTKKTINTLESYYKIKIVDGRYWYDRDSGLWGIEGQPVMGIILAGMNLGDELKEDASAGDSGVFINGREITRYELAELVKMTQSYITPGRYWLDANGFVGHEGMPAVANLFQIAAQYYGRNNQSTFYRNHYTGTGSGSDGDTFYVIGKGFSYIN